MKGEKVITHEPCRSDADILPTRPGSGYLHCRSIYRVAVTPKVVLRDFLLQAAMMLGSMYCTLAMSSSLEDQVVSLDAQLSGLLKLKRKVPKAQRRGILLDQVNEQL